MREARDAPLPRRGTSVLAVTLALGCATGPAHRIRVESRVAGTRAEVRALDGSGQVQQRHEAGLPEVFRVDTYPDPGSAGRILAVAGGVVLAVGASMILVAELTYDSGTFVGPGEGSDDLIGCRFCGSPEGVAGLVTALVGAAVGVAGLGWWGLAEALAPSPPAAVEIEVRAPGHRPATRTVRLPAAPDDPLTVRLDPGDYVR